MSEREIIEAACYYLRGKNAYGTSEGGGMPFLTFDPGTTTYRCICTMGPTGPDGQPVHLNLCKESSRRCYKEPKKN